MRYLKLSIALVVFFLICLFFLNFGPIEKRKGPFSGAGGGQKDIDSLHVTILPGGAHKLDSLRVTSDSFNLTVAIPFSKKIKFVFDTIRNNRKIFLLDTASKKQIRFLPKFSLWRGLNQKAFKTISRY